MIKAPSYINIVKSHINNCALDIDIVNIDEHTTYRTDAERSYPTMSNRKLPLLCPACSETMHVTELTCPHCNTRVQGEFATFGLFQLTPEQLQFVEVFVRCRGNIKEVERDLKISYPTVRSRLDQVIQAMGYAISTPEEDEQTTHILQALDNGELSFEQAMEILKGGQGHE